MDETLNKVAAIYYPIYFLCGVSLNILMYYLIFKKTTPVFKTMRYFLIPSNTSTMIVTFLTFFVQVRTIHNTTSLAIAGQGYCKYLGEKACFHGYELFLAMSCVVGILNMHTIFYRMVCVLFRDKKQVSHRTMLFCIHYYVPINAFIFCELVDFNVPLVHNETITQHPSYHLEPYGNFGGIADSHNVLTTVVTMSLGSMCIYAPIFAFYCRRIAMKELDSNRTSLSGKSLLQVRTFTNGLTLQVALPLICYVPLSIAFMYDKYSGEDPIPVSEYGMGTVLVLPSVCDPLLCMYFIVPYRNALKQLLRYSTPSPSEVGSDVNPTEMFQRSVAIDY